MLDFGALGKGWLVDEVTALLAEHGVTGAVVATRSTLRPLGIRKVKVDAFSGYRAATERQLSGCRRARNRAGGRFRPWG